MLISIIVTIIPFIKQRHLAVWFVTYLVSGVIMNKLIKDTVLRPRPYNHLAVDTGFSFRVDIQRQHIIIFRLNDHYYFSCC